MIWFSEKHQNVFEWDRAPNYLALKVGISRVYFESDIKSVARFRSWKVAKTTKGTNTRFDQRKGTEMFRKHNLFYPLFCHWIRILFITANFFEAKLRKLWWCAFFDFSIQYKNGLVGGIKRDAGIYHKYGTSATKQLYINMCARKENLVTKKR